MAFLPNHPSPGRFQRIGSSGLALGLALALAGCGEKKFDVYSGPVSPVSGKVLLANGQPLTAGKIYFLPGELGAMAATGDIKNDGTFTLKAGDGRDGAPPGKYKIRIVPDPSTMIKKGKTLIPPFPPVYADEDGESGLTATVKSEETKLEPFKLVVPEAEIAKAKFRD